MKRTLLLFTLINILFINITIAQTKFFRSDSIIVLAVNGDTLQNPWTGGFNAVQFSEVDLNIDGVMDLFVYDRTGNKISTFINAGIPNTIQYKHEPYYQQFFPNDLNGWVLLRDYNCDGKVDLFTSYKGGIAAYKNNSTTQLSFELDTNQLFSDSQPDSINPVYQNIFLSSADIPAFDDIDNDGDLDLLALSNVGDRVVYHKNMSMEKYGNCSALDFQVRNKCWGYFKENALINQVVLYDTCTINIGSPEKSTPRDKHIGGSSFFTLDVDGNNSKDLVIGGNSFKDLLLLINSDLSPNLTASSVSSQNTNFPSNTTSTSAVNIDHFPAGFYIDVNNNNIKDLIASANCTFSCQDMKNVWHYENTGANNNPDFNFTSNSFLQDDMIEIGSGAHPVFFDYNADGLDDIIIGNYGYYEPLVTEFYISSLWLYENIGTLTKPRYQLVDSNYLNIPSLDLDLFSTRKTLSIIPCFGDIDGDGDEDLLLGDYLGHLHYFENSAGPGNPASFSLTQAEYAGLDVGTNASPQLIDLNRDNLLDLVIGKEDGFISYYENTGTALAPIFTLTTNSLGNVHTKRPSDFKGNSTPFVYDDGGTYSILSGSNHGALFKFTNIDGNLGGTFTADTSYLGIWEGIQSTINMNDINNDGVIDFIIGNYAGGVSMYQGYTPNNISSFQYSQSSINIYPNPAKDQLNVTINDDDIKIDFVTILDLSGKVLFSEKTENTSIIINLNGISKGIYFVKVNTINGYTTKKFIKN